MMTQMNDLIQFYPIQMSIILQYHQYQYLYSMHLCSTTFFGPLSSIVPLWVKGVVSQNCLLVTLSYCNIMNSTQSTTREVNILSPAKSVSVWQQEFFKIVERRTFNLEKVHTFTVKEHKLSKIYNARQSWHTKNRKSAGN